MDALWSHQAGSMVALCYDVWVAKDDGRNFGLLTIGLCCDTQPPTSSWCLVRRCGSKFRPNPWTRLEVVYHNQKWSLEAQNCAHHVHVGHHVYISHHCTSLKWSKSTHRTKIFWRSNLEIWKSRSKTLFFAGGSGLPDFIRQKMNTKYGPTTRKNWDHWAAAEGPLWDR